MNAASSSEHQIDVDEVLAEGARALRRWEERCMLFHAFIRLLFSFL